MRLNLTQLDQLNPEVSRPVYLIGNLDGELHGELNGELDGELDEEPDGKRQVKRDERPGAGILHFGLGQFAKGHLLAYTNQLLNQQPDDWRVIGVSFRSNSAEQQLAPQDYLYSLVTQSVAGQEATIVGALADVISLPNQGDEKLRTAILDPAIRIVSLTITEKGYYQLQGGLNLLHPDIQADLTNPDSPRTAIGWLAHGLKLRRDQGLEPFTILSLDNLRGNGKVLRSAVLTYCEQFDPSLAMFVSDQVSFPSSMVDRIVPATDSESRRLTFEKIGVEDASPVVTETFSQWVLEDRFTQGRPEWEQVGVIFCDDIEIFESMKLRLLNGAHSAMAYWGVLAELETVADCMAFAPLRAYIERLLLTEVLTEVAAPPGIALGDYIADLMVRFSNPYLRHRCAQIAMDGSEKIPQRWLPVIEGRLEHNQSIELLAFAVAGWMSFVHDREDIEDPVAENLRALASATTPDQLVAQLIKRSGIFSPTLQSSNWFEQSVTEAVRSIQTLGVRSALESLLERT